MSRLFAAAYDCVMAPLERGRFLAVRRALLAQARGRVLEIGAGTGINFGLYPPGVDEVQALEPDAAMSARARARLPAAGPDVRLVQARAETLPYPAASFDTVVSTLVLCTVHDPQASLREAYRVLRPGGLLLIFEHVRLDHPALACAQRALTPLWQQLAGGCRLDRDTLRSVREAGFEALAELPGSGALFRVATARRP